MQLLKTSGVTILRWRTCGTAKFTDAQVEAAVDQWVDTWDLTTLQVYAYENLLDYFLTVADEEELTMFMEEANNG